MDANLITTLIGSLGFPIVACVGMGWYIVKNEKLHKEETDKLTQAIQNNTIVMTQLVEKLEKKNV